jgi:CHAT domain-containing protein
MPVVQFHVSATDILAFIHYRGGSRSHRYTDGANGTRQFLARWRHQIEFAATNGTAVSRTRLKEEETLLADFAEWILPPLELPGIETPLLILPEGILFGVPWSVLPVGRERLLDRYEVTMAPSLTHFRHSAGRRLSGEAFRIFVGSRTGLPHLSSEIDAVERRLHGPSLHLHDPCRREDWPDGVCDRVWHFAGHAALRRDNPFYSSLILDDGPLFAADLRLMRNQVGLITLAACRTGQHTGLPGEEASALVRSLLEMGGRNVVASQWAISDRSTPVWMDLFYKHYLDGAPAARAVRRAAQGVKERFPSVYDWGAFSLFGAG